MKTTIIIIRIVTGLLYTVSSIAYFFDLMPHQEMHGPTLAFVQGLSAAGYFMPFLKTIELIFGLALIFGRFVPLAVVVLFPITLNIFLFHAFLAPQDMIVPSALLAANVFLAFAYRQNYQTLITAR